jgi:excisionase family DNA binding protein
MGEDRDTAQDRVTIQEAARRLGVKEDAIRKRIQRGTLRHEKTEKGRVFVWVDATQDTTEDVAQDTYRDAVRYREPDALISAKDETIAALREQLEQANERDRENRRIIAALTSRIPELPAAASPASEEPEESPETSREHGGTFKVIDAHSDRPGAREPPESSENVADEQQGRGAHP